MPMAEIKNPSVDGFHQIHVLGESIDQQLKRNNGPPLTTMKYE
ncbi:MAG: hypothetical protein R2877_06760 [Bdellovibrionota bacterium]